MVLDYDLDLTEATSSLPLDAPAMFYIGFHGGDSGKAEAGWEKIRNGLLIQHVREISPHEENMYRNLEAEQVAWLLNNETYENLSDDMRLKLLSKRNQCGTDGRNKISNLWKGPVSQELLDKAGGDQYNAIVKTASDTGISIIADESWSAMKHLKYKGSTHNVYLDWLYYVGSSEEFVGAI